ncbi:hypothetical protein F4821DRAFT_260668 [Hypoxylon rubiginosum]|uniref:Uncharacterized protein n=1 Tax=Hypoxylon rubiginosum TaxID=110542 RepID=A0ACC0CZ49_9PEZI|nr:hypothetical protein F4821DRAFT_260668 [Hypoxylon rubiginosum]
MPSSQRPFFLSSFLAAFRQQAPPALSASQANKHTSTPSTTNSASATGARSMSSTTPHQNASSPDQSQSQQQQRPSGIMNQLPSHRHQSHHHHSPQSHRPGMPIPAPGRRRGSDSSSEGFRDVLGADKWYIGGRTAAGEEKFFKLGVVKRVRSQDRLSLDRLSL